MVAAGLGRPAAFLFPPTSKTPSLGMAIPPSDYPSQPQCPRICRHALYQDTDKGGSYTARSTEIVTRKANALAARAGRKTSRETCADR